MLTPLPRFATRLVVDEDLWPDDFGFDEGDAAELDAALARRTPAHILQVGSGAATLLLAAYAQVTGGSVLTLEPVPARRTRTLHLLDDAGLLGLVSIDDCGVPGDLADATAPAPAPNLHPTLVVVDGHAFDADGLTGILDLAAGFVHAGAELWMSRGTDDTIADRTRRWADSLGLHVQPSRRRYRLTRVVQDDSTCDAARVDAGRVVVTFLCGGRPELAANTLRSLRDNAPGLLESAHVVAFHNAQDTSTAAVLDGFTDVIDQRLGGNRATVPIGEAVSLLAEHADRSGRPFWLHLEDDWMCDTWTAGWLARAQQILDDEPAAHQVRLRHIGDRIQHDNFVTGDIVTWDSAGDIRVSTNANWTFNPTLVRTSEAARIFPVAGEANAVRKATFHGLTGTVQLLPGAFNHTGLDDSLRKRLKSSM